MKLFLLLLCATLAFAVTPLTQSYTESVMEACANQPPRLKRMLWQLSVICLSDDVSYDCTEIYADTALDATEKVLRATQLLLEATHEGFVREFMEKHAIDLYVGNSKTGQHLDRIDM
jgi:hypothetical protein